MEAILVYLKELPEKSGKYHEKTESRRTSKETEIRARCLASEGVQHCNYTGIRVALVNISTVCSGGFVNPRDSNLKQVTVISSLSLIFTAISPSAGKYLDLRG
jgi:hypothetical protein